MDNSANESAAKRLVPFTGYYTLDAKSGAFLLIDTNSIYQNDGGVVTITHTATVTLSTDGIESTAYQVEDYPPAWDIEIPNYCTFDKGELVVVSRGERIVNVHLAKDFSNGSSSALSGNILGWVGRAVTPFSAIHLPMFAGKYYGPISENSVATDLSSRERLAEPIQAQLVIEADHSLWYNDGAGLAQVNSYSYNYAMFVISFPLPKPEHVLEMGTASGFGRVAGNSAEPGLLVSVLPVKTNPAPFPSAEMA